MPDLFSSSVVQLSVAERAEARRESALRARVRRRGFRLAKSRSRTPEHPEYGLFHIVDPYYNVIVAGYAGSGYSMTLDDVEAWLTEE